jgi:hypothetical protein
MLDLRDVIGTGNPIEIFVPVEGTRVIDGITRPVEGAPESIRIDGCEVQETGGLAFLRDGGFSSGGTGVLFAPVHPEIQNDRQFIDVRTGKRWQIQNVEDWQTHILAPITEIRENAER